MIDLDALARRVASELARADRPLTVGASERGNGRASAVKTGSAVTASSAPATRWPSGSAASSPPGVAFVREDARMADFIDHTLLRAEATPRDVEQLCDEALEHRFAAVCINPVWVPLCARRLAGSKVRVATVIGFPLGANNTSSKAAEAERAAGDGAAELDMVAAIGHIKGGDWVHVADDIAAVVRAAGDRLVKVIIESAALTPVEVIKACALAREVGAHYVKTSTGFHPAGGATAEAVALMRLVVGDALGVKASGGVRDCAAALKMIAAGATRIGTSSGVAMTKCLGPGPLPLAELLAAPHAHAHQCVSCSAPSSEPPATAGPY
ncbi:MAG TPA: deoxyribose-phosphate aldolase [Gemmatimonadaceae bacterium]|nr:deoxyribose-phosphate aldolase [Gemmatimonadaceae bacterium]